MFVLKLLQTDGLTRALRLRWEEGEWNLSWNIFGLLNFVLGVAGLLNFVVGLLEILDYFFIERRNSVKRHRHFASSPVFFFQMLAEPEYAFSSQAFPLFFYSFSPFPCGWLSATWLTSMSKSNGMAFSLPETPTSQSIIKFSLKLTFCGLWISFHKFMRQAPKSHSLAQSGFDGCGVFQDSNKGSVILKDSLIFPYDFEQTTI